MTSVETTDQFLRAEQWRRETEHTLYPGVSRAKSADCGDVPDASQFWVSVFSRYFPDSGERSAFREDTLQRLQALVIAAREATKGGGRGNPPLFRKAFMKLSELPLRSAKRSANDWGEVAFGLALQALLDKAAVNDHHAKFRLIVAARDAYSRLRGKIADELLDPSNPDAVAAHRQAERLVTKWLRHPDLCNEQGWPLLELCMRSLVEFIVAYTELFQKTEDSKSRGIADIELEAGKKCRALIERGGSPGIPANYPMLVPPRNWQPGWRGGHLHGARSLVKLERTNALSADVKHLIERSDMPRVFSALNILQRTGWRINRPVLDACRQIYHSAPETELGQEQMRLRLAEKHECTIIKGQAGSDPKFHFVRTTEGLESHRTAPSVKGQLDQLDDLAKQEAFFFPYQIDYRGRIYPQATWLSPQSDDLAKGLLEFSIGKPIKASEGEALKFLAAYGSQFVSDKTIIRELELSGDRIPDFDERLRWIKLHEDDIVRSATTPHQCDWWLAVSKSKSRWQMLAFCCAWKDMLDGKPSHLPVYIDGTCNGLQHMAALLRDRTLARHTNLLKSEAKQDTYTWILRAVEEKIDLVAADPNDQFQALAIWIQQHDLISRDAAKKVVMLFSYGSDRYKDKLQDFIAEHLSPIDKKNVIDWGGLLGALKKAGPIPYSIAVPGWDTGKMKASAPGDAGVEGGNDGNEDANEEANEDGEDSGNSDGDNGPDDRPQVSDAKKFMPDSAQLDAWCRQIDNRDEMQAVIDSDDRRLLRKFCYDRLAAYLTTLFTPVMEEKLPTAFEFLRLLRGWSDEVTKATRLPLCWVSPAGLPVIQILEMGQPKKKKEEKKDPDESGSAAADKKKPKPATTENRMKHIDWSGFGELKKHLPDGMPVAIEFADLRQIPKMILPNELTNTSRQRSAFPPNLIHSLDASHLMLTISRSAQLGIEAFAAVHDSFATHAIDVPKLGRALRDSFMLMHRAPLLDEYRAWFELLRNTQSPPPPILGPMEGNLLALWRQHWQVTDAACAATLPSAPVPETDQRFDIDEIGESDYIFF